MGRMKRGEMLKKKRENMGRKEEDRGGNEVYSVGRRNREERWEESEV